MRITLIVALLGLAACKPEPQQQPAANEVANSEQEVSLIHGLDRSHEGQAAPTATFEDPQGVAASLHGFEHRPVLVNLWATWCAPCVKELPTLDRLAERQPRKAGSLAVVTINQDSAPRASVQAFFDQHGIRNLELFQDSKMAWSGALGPDTVLPTTILYGTDGKEVWRYVGDRDWTDAESAKLLAEASPLKGG